MKDNNNKNHNSDKKEADNLFREYIQNNQDFHELKNHKHNPFELEQKEQTNSKVVHTNNHNSHNYHHQYHNNIDNNQINRIQLSDHLWRPEVSADDYLFYFQTGVQYRTIRKFRAGKIRIEATLDLHQMNKEQARHAFSAFISDCFDQEMRCICVIHGKGSRAGQSDKPILKNLVNHWLYDIGVILGFCSCPSNMGGTGAVLILLQRNLD